MKTDRINKFINHCNKVKELGISYKQYEKEGYVSKNYFGTTSYALKKEVPTELIKEALDVYNSNKRNNREQLDNTDTSETGYNREDGKIVSYYYTIYRQNKPALTGNLDRNEMNTIHRLYSYYGDSLTQRIISRQFPELSLVDFKRILRAFNITKASAPFAPHMFEEHTEEELREIQLREKENSFLRKAEEDVIRNNEKLLKKYAQENIELKKQLENLSNFNINLPKNINPVELPVYEYSGNSLILHLSDLHIGASVTSGTLYKENINYGKEECKRRLEVILNKINSLPMLDTIVINLLGDNVDCCGVNGKTARLDHYMPENMDAREQGNAYIELMIWFIDSLITNELCSNIKIYSVPTGNHGGTMEYFCNKALLMYINVKYPQIETKLFEEFFGVYTFNNHNWVICHGKDHEYMKKGLPLNINDKTQVMVYEWLNNNQIYGDNIHIIKGDLHSNNINSCKRFDYRNVLSLFGGSDYSSYNFSRNSWGMSFELFIGDNLVRGTFENM